MTGFYMQVAAVTTNPYIRLPHLVATRACGAY